MTKSIILFKPVIVLNTNILNIRKNFADADILLIGRIYKYCMKFLYFFAD